MMLKNLKRVSRLLAFLFVGLAFAITYNAANGRGLPATNGIVNFGKISDVLYRGAQPDEIGVTNLARLGIKTIINLRMSDDIWRPEEAQARSCGILYTNVPFKGLGRPTDQQVQTVLGMIDSLPGPVFIHCQRGCDRTGTIVACYRIRHDHWSLDTALKEANHYGLSLFERGMKHFIVDFARGKGFEARPAVLASRDH